MTIEEKLIVYRNLAKMFGELSDMTEKLAVECAEKKPSEEPKPAQAPSLVRDSLDEAHSISMCQDVIGKIVYAPNSIPEIVKKAYAENALSCALLDADAASKKPVDPKTNAISSPSFGEIPCQIGKVTAWISFMRVGGQKPFSWTARLDPTASGLLGHNQTEKTKASTAYLKHCVAKVFLAQVYAIRDSDEHKPELRKIVKAMTKAETAYSTGKEAK